MKQRATILALFLAAAVPFGAGSGAARAQLSEPLRFGNALPLKDCFDRCLDGPGYENPAIVDIFVQEARSQEVLLTNVTVGANAMPGCGYFSMALPKRLGTNSTLRAVAYDAASSNEASFCRTAVSKVPPSGRILFKFGNLMPMSKFGSDEDAVDYAYADALDRLQASGVDSDGDGMSDYVEVLAGTGLEDATSLFAFESIEPVVSTGIRALDTDSSVMTLNIQWHSVPGRRYRLQYASSLLPDEKKGEVIWTDVLSEPVTAVSDLTTVPVEVDLDDDTFRNGHFRLLLVL